LLRSIELEKQRLVKKGKIKKSKPLPEIENDKVPYQLPLSWKWIRLGNITTLQNGFAFKSDNYISQGIKLIRNVNIGHGSVDHENIAYYPDSEREKFKDFELSQGDILLSLDRPIISTGLKIAVLKENDVPSLLVQRVGRIEVKSLKINPSFLLNWFNSSLFIDRIIPGRSNGVPHISTKEVETLLFPLPPLAEQRRIVEKIDRLMGMCDRLEGSIESGKVKQTDLLNALMSQV
jgi:type I restriction enzyme, S subunit